MATSSGVVLDYLSNLAVRDATVYLFDSANTLYATALTNPQGVFSISKPATPQQLTYTAHKDGYNSFSLNLNQASSFVTLNLNPQNPISVSGSILSVRKAAISTGSEVKDVKETPVHFYVLTEGGLDVVERSSLENVAYLQGTDFSSIGLLRGVTSSSGVLIGTTSGVLEFKVPTTYTGGSLQSLITNKFNVANGRLLTNNPLKISKNIGGDTVIATSSGIDYINIFGTRYFSQFPSNINVTALALAEDGSIYYSPSNSGVYVKSAPITANWTLPDYQVLLSGTGSYPFPLLSNYINDIEISVTPSGNSVALATRSGIVIYDEYLPNLNISASGAKLIRNYP